MTYSSPTNPSILQDGRIKPGIYKIKNIVSQTYVDTKDHVRELCGRPSSALQKSGGQVSLWVYRTSVYHLTTTYSGRSSTRARGTRFERFAPIHALFLLPPLR